MMSHQYIVITLFTYHTSGRDLIDPDDLKAMLGDGRVV